MRLTADNQVVTFYLEIDHRNPHPASVAVLTLFPMPCSLPAHNELSPLLRHCHATAHGSLRLSRVSLSNAERARNVSCGLYGNALRTTPSCLRNNRQVPLRARQTAHEEVAAIAQKINREPTPAPGARVVQTEQAQPKHRERKGGALVQAAPEVEVGSQGFSCPRNSPPGFAAVWTLTYRFPAWKLANCASVSIAPEGAE